MKDEIKFTNAEKSILAYEILNKFLEKAYKYNKKLTNYKGTKTVTFNDFKAMWNNDGRMKMYVVSL